MDVADFCLNASWAFTSRSNIRELLLEDVSSCITKAFESHWQDAMFVQAACSAIVRLRIGDPRLEAASSCNARALESLRQDGPVAQAACSVVVRLRMGDTWTMLMGLLLKAMTLHRDDLQSQLWGLAAVASLLKCVSPHADKLAVSFYPLEVLTPSEPWQAHAAKVCDRKVMINADCSELLWVAGRLSRQAMATFENSVQIRRWGSVVVLLVEGQLNVYRDMLAIGLQGRVKAASVGIFRHMVRQWIKNQRSESLVDVLVSLGDDLFRIWWFRQTD